MKRCSRPWWPCALAGSVALAGVPALAADDAGQGAVIRFKSGAAPMHALTTPDERAKAIGPLANPDAPRRVVVQFAAPLMPAQRTLLARNGLSLQAYLGDHAYFATLAPGAELRADNLAAFEPLRSIAGIERPWKLHPLLLGNEPLTWAEVPVAGRDATDPIVGVYVLFHADAPMGLDATQLAQKHGGNVRVELRTVRGLVVEMPRSSIPALADEDAVQWIEPALPMMSTLSAMRNDNNRVRVGVDIVNEAPYSLDGTGVTAFIYDAGAARATHNTFGGRLTRIDNDSVVSHATHVSGTVGGSGAGSTPLRAGMAPNATLLSAGLQYDQGQGTFLYNNPGDIEVDYDAAINSHAADIANNSIGTNVSTNNFPCVMQGDYALTDSIIDSIVRGSLGRPLRIVWANGNERQSTRCDVEGHGQYYSIAPPSGAKNHLTVGALNSNDDSMTSFSSWGPTDDGRMKPDISAPGCQSSGNDTGVTSSTSSSDSSYGSSCGTSMAAPTVTGVAALILQDFRANFPGLPDPSSATLRALFAHTAVDLFNPGPDYKCGYGSIRAVDAIEFMRTGRMQESSVGQGEVFSTTVSVSGDGPLKVTIAWNDAPGTPNAAVASVNDLDVRLIDPSGVTHHAWTLDPENPADDAVRTGPNRRDNIEQVLVDNPAAGTWTVEVVGFNVPEGPQSFSIVGAGFTTSVLFETVGEVPLLVDPGAATTFDVFVRPINQDLLAGSAELHYRTDGGEFSSAPLSSLGEDLYRVTLPALTCEQSVEYYIIASGSFSGTRTLPLGAPDALFTTSAGDDEIPFTDSFDTATGWTVTDVPSGAGTFSGSWMRGVPIPATGTPIEDAEDDGAGFCFVTDNRVGNFDIDNGSTILTSPRMDATGVGARITYARWFYNLNAQLDTLRVEISGDDGSSWTLLEEVGPAGLEASGGWRTVTLPIPQALATENFRIRFITGDLGSASIVEAGIDAVELIARQCEDVPVTCAADWNEDATVNSGDISAFLTSWLASVQAPDLTADFNADGTTNSGDISSFLTAWLDAVQNGC